MIVCRQDSRWNLGEWLEVANVLLFCLLFKLEGLKLPLSPFFPSSIRLSRQKLSELVWIFMFNSATLVELEVLVLPLVFPPSAAVKSPIFLCGKLREFIVIKQIPPPNWNHFLCIFLPPKAFWNCQIYLWYYISQLKFWHASMLNIILFLFHQLYLLTTISGACISHLPNMHGVGFSKVAVPLMSWFIYVL